MAILKNRPLFSASLLYIICAYIGYLSDFRTKLILCGIGLLALVAYTVLCLVRKLFGRTAIITGLCVGAVVLSLCSSLICIDLAQARYQKYAEQETCTVTATVTQRAVSDRITVYVVRVEQIDGKKERFDAQLTCNFTSYLQVGHQFTATVQPATFDDDANGYYNKTRALANSLHMDLTCESEQDVIMLGENDTLPLIALHRLNGSLTHILQKYCGDEAGGIAAAFLLGNRSGLSGEISRDFSRAGASHMLALSGMHVSILIGALSWLLSKAKMHRKARAVFLAGASVGYLLVTGVSISATRAVVMICILQLSNLLASDNDSLTTLAVTGAGILFFSPYSVCDTGFCLSFLATFGIIVLIPPLHTYMESRKQAFAKPPHMRLKKRLASIAFPIAEILLVGVVACASIMVPACFLLGSESVFSPLTTLVISPLVSGILICAALVLLSSPLSFLANFFATLIRLFARLTLSYTQRISEIDGVLLPLTYTAVQVLAIVFCVSMLILLVLHLRRKWLLALPPAMLALCLCIFYPVNNAYQDAYLNAAYTHTSSRNEALVTADGYRAYVCDLSLGSIGAMRAAMDASEALHATELGAVVLTDCLPSHSASLTQLFSSYKTDAIYLPRQVSGVDVDTRAHLCGIAEQYGVAVVDYDYGQPIELYDGAILTVHRSDLSRSDQPLLVVTLERGDACISMIGAAAQHSELSGQAASAAKEADVLIYPERGPSPRLSYGLALGQDADVVFASDAVASYCDPESVANAKVLIANPEFLEICLATKQEP